MTRFIEIKYLPNWMNKDYKQKMLVNIDKISNILNARDGVVLRIDGNAYYIDGSYESIRNELLDCGYFDE